MGGVEMLLLAEEQKASEVQSNTEDKKENFITTNPCHNPLWKMIF